MWRYDKIIRDKVINTEFIDVMYKTLSSGKPVPFEWAAKSGEEWTLHYSLIIGADIPNDVITVANDSNNKAVKLSFAYGHAICTSSQNYSIHDSERIADKEMYECKRMMKAERQD